MPYEEEDTQWDVSHYAVLACFPDDISRFEFRVSGLGFRV
jgi:hypothetical protein